jgi:phenylacetate-CoA ligase
VRPGTGDPVAPGEVGEVVVTRLNADYPLLRFGTGDLSPCCRALAPAGAPTCASRAGWAAPTRPPRSRACSCIPSQIAEIGKRHPELGRLRLVVTRANEQDAMLLRAELRGRPEAAGRKARRDACSR